jgi:Asp-tRNA(Asn)/Glu-tRNA(Gln) amidotransferase A subunit family amidase
MPRFAFRSGRVYLNGSKAWIVTAEDSMNMKPLYCMGLDEAGKALRDGSLSSEDLTRALLERIAAREDRVQAFQWIDPEHALALARARDERLRQGGPAGVLHGAPVGVKDIIDTQGILTRMGSPIFESNLPSSSAAVVERLEQAGAFVMGKTVTTEFAYYAPGKTRNPWNPAHTPGGSSSGSAAAVAVGFVPAAVGTQTNGSVIRPAAFCGVVGYKPTAGTIPASGVRPFSVSLDQVGVFGRSVPDVALLAAVLSSGDGSGNGGIPGDVAAAARPPRLIAVRSPVWDLASAPMQEHFRATVERLRVAGADVLEHELPESFADAHAVHRTIMYGEGAREFESLQRTNRKQLSAVLNQLIDEGLRITDSALIESLGHRRRLKRELGEFLRGYDGIVTPPAPDEAPADLSQTGNPTFCTIWTLCETPAVTIPTGFGPRGLPLGLQIVGPAFADGNLLGVAAWCDERVGQHKRVVD